MATRSPARLVMATHISYREGATGASRKALSEMERTIAIPQGWGNSTARREEWSKCVARYAALCSKPCVGDGDEDLPGKSTPTSSGALDHLASIATEELLRRRSKRKRSIIDRPLGEAPVPVVERVLNHWLTGLFRTASGETASAHTLALSPTPHTQHHVRRALTHSASRLCFRWQKSCSSPTPSSPSSSPSRGRPRRPPCRGVPTLATRRLATPHQGAAAVDVCRGCAL